MKPNLFFCHNIVYTLYRPSLFGYPGKTPLIISEFTRFKRLVQGHACTLFEDVYKLLYVVEYTLLPNTVMVMVVK